MKKLLLVLFCLMSTLSLSVGLYFDTILRDYGNCQIQSSKYNEQGIKRIDFVRNNRCCRAYLVAEEGMYDLAISIVGDTDNFIRNEKVGHIESEINRDKYGDPIPLSDGREYYRFEIYQFEGVLNSMGYWCIITSPFDGYDYVLAEDPCDVYHNVIFMGSGGIPEEALENAMFITNLYIEHMLYNKPFKREDIKWSKANYKFSRDVE